MLYWILQRKQKLKHEKIKVHTLFINLVIVVIDKQRLIRKLGNLSPNYLLMLKVALDYTLQLDNYNEENAD